MMATGMFVVIYPVWVAYSLLDRRWERIGPVQTETAVEADEHGITFSNPKMHGTWAWAAIREVRETRSLFILFTEDGDNLASVPKRRLGAAEQGQLRRLFAEHVAAPVKGFPVVVRGRREE